MVMWLYYTLPETLPVIVVTKKVHTSPTMVYIV